MRVAHLVSYWGFFFFFTIHTILFAALLTTQQLNVRKAKMRSMRKRTEETNTEGESDYTQHPLFIGNTKR